MERLTDEIWAEMLASTTKQVASTYYTAVWNIKRGSLTKYANKPYGDKNQMVYVLPYTGKLILCLHH